MPLGHAVGHFLARHIHLNVANLPALLAETAAVSAFFGSCCALPLFLLFTGVGSMAFAMWMMPYRPYFIGFTLALLGVSFYLVYRRKSVCTRNTCSPKKILRTKIMLWVSTTFTLLFLVGPYCYEWFKK